MSFTRTGLILYTHRYTECIAFYRDTVGLPLMFRNNQVTCFAFGESYLMVEPDGSPDSDRERQGLRTCLRMNVANVRTHADALIANGIDVDYQEHDWGTIALFRDPDGNLCAFKDDETFEAQVLAG